MEETLSFTDQTLIRVTSCLARFQRGRMCLTFAFFCVFVIVVDVYAVFTRELVLETREMILF